MARGSLDLRRHLPSVTFVLILLFAVVFLGEPLTLAKITGTTLIVTGIAIMAYHS